MKYSKQRELILQTVKARCDHPTADEIYTELKPQNPALSLGTVYRNLNMLAQMGEIAKVPIASGSDRFDKTTEPHHHMICENCGGVFDIRLGAFSEMLAKAENESGFRVKRGELTIYGICRACDKGSGLADKT